MNLLYPSGRELLIIDFGSVYFQITGCGLCS